MTTRREFLKFLGAAATLAAVPAIARGRLIAEAPLCTGRTVLLECAPPLGRSAFRTPAKVR